MSTDDQTSGERWLDMTNAAYDKVTGFLVQVAQPERQAMWIEVTGTSANHWTCSISLKPLDAAAPHDAIVRHRDLAIVVPECDFDKVRGATIDWLDDPFGTTPCSSTPASPTRPPRSPGSTAASCASASQPAETSARFLHENRG
jgi:Fe-S cluster assembly iron-binding protein IscA